MAKYSSAFNSNNQYLILENPFRHKTISTINAGCIFYAQNSVTGRKTAETLIAHETAHQWFGDAVTEQNWHHIWLSEGFATYLTNIYVQHFFGRQEFIKRLQNDRNRVIGYATRNLTPAIDTTITNYNRLLNANSYQKAGWFLHMLCNKLGDSLFFEGVSKYYQIYKDSTALTSDFQAVMEQTGHQKLNSFFHQWLWQPGVPKIKTYWSQNPNKKINLRLRHFVDLFLDTVWVIPNIVLQ